MPRKTFVSGEILTAADVNTNLMDQAVMTFADAAARDSAIPSPSAGMVTFLADTTYIEKYTGTGWAQAGNAFTASATITATDPSWNIPTLGSPIVKVTAVGGGGGGGGGAVNNGRLPEGGDGGTTTVVCAAGTITAVGGLGANGGGNNTGNPGFAGTDGLSAGNHGSEGLWSGNSQQASGATGLGGQISVGYLDLTGLSTLNITVGAGGAGGSHATSVSGGAGGRGEVIVEYVAG